MAEIDAIKGLLEIEKNAEAITEKAKNEADKNIVEARNKADSEYKFRCEQLFKELEAECNDRIEGVKQNYANQLESYKKQIYDIKLDKELFSDVLTKILFSPTKK